jgi:hypothetical protein
MLTLHGFSSSNHYNIIKLTLLEKGVPFKESVVYSGAGERSVHGGRRRRDHSFSGRSGRGE